MRPQVDVAGEGTLRGWLLSCVVQTAPVAQLLILLDTDFPAAVDQYGCY